MTLASFCDEMLKVDTTSCSVSNVDGRSQVVMDERRDAVESDPTSFGTFIGNTDKASLDAGDLHPVA